MRLEAGLCLKPLGELKALPRLPSWIWGDGQGKRRIGKGMAHRGKGKGVTERAERGEMG